MTSRYRLASRICGSARERAARFLMSDNAQPITMLQIDNVSPFEFPLLSHFLGPARMTSFLGQLAGQSWVYNPPLAVGLNPTIDPSFLRRTEFPVRSPSFMATRSASVPPRTWSLAWG